MDSKDRSNAQMLVRDFSGTISANMGLCTLFTYQRILEIWVYAYLISSAHFKTSIVLACHSNMTLWILTQQQHICGGMNLYLYSGLSQRVQSSSRMTPTITWGMQRSAVKSKFQLDTSCLQFFHLYKTGCFGKKMCVQEKEVEQQS